MINTIKFYGKTLRTWKHWVTRTTYLGNTYEEEVINQYEVAYKEYTTDGELIAKGSEDFSTDRYNDMKYYRVFAWDGKKYNKGGNRWFEEIAGIKVMKGNKADALKIVKTWFPDAALIQLR